jgi:hypothetical protein
MKNKEENSSPWTQHLLPLGEPISRSQRLKKSKFSRSLSLKKSKIQEAKIEEIEVFKKLKFEEVKD